MLCAFTCKHSKFERKFKDWYIVRSLIEVNSSAIDATSLVDTLRKGVLQLLHHVSQLSCIPTTITPLDQCTAEASVVDAISR